jgi:23S rRNA (guanosine2251-2'-O)-methyltransferase
MKELIYGRNSVLEWLQSNLQVRRIFLASGQKGDTISEILHMAKKRRIQIENSDRSRLDKLLQHSHHQGVVAEVYYEYSEIENILAVAEAKKEAPILALLDSIQDPHNLGAILRTADAAGFHGIIIPKDNSVGVTPTVVKASAGAIAHIPIVQVTNLARTIKDLKKQGFWFYGSVENSDKLYTDVDYAGPAGIIMGSEGTGLRRLVRENCDFLISIPMYGKINSLNVSVASALVFYEARKKRENKGLN